MAQLYLDHDVSRLTMPYLTGAGHEARTARDIGMERAGDEEHLFIAAEQEWGLVTHNIGDFTLLHHAWRRWSSAWNVTATHAGILILDHRPPRELAMTLNAFLELNPPLSNELYRWRQRHGWTHES